MKQYQALLRKNLCGIIGVALLAVLTSFAMVFAGYSLSFLFTAYEQEGDRVNALIYTFLFVALIWLIAMLVYTIALHATKQDRRKHIGSNCGVKQ